MTYLWLQSGRLKTRIPIITLNAFVALKDKRVKKTNMILKLLLWFFCEHSVLETKGRIYKVQSNTHSVKWNYSLNPQMSNREVTT